MSVANVTLTDPQDGELTGELRGPLAVELVGASEPVVLGEFEAPEGRWDVAFAVTAPAASQSGPNTDPAAVAEMAQRRAVHRIEGTAKKEDEDLSFEWYFTRPVGASLCRNGVDDTVGLATVAEQTSLLSATFHADHLLWDQLGTEEATLTFAGLAAADRDGDRVITEAELRATTTQEAGYETAGLDLPDLWSYLSFSVAQSAHLNGGGLCQIRAL